jgi:hypothetical protein
MSDVSNLRPLSIEELHHGFNKALGLARVGELCARQLDDEDDRRNMESVFASIWETLNPLYEELKKEFDEACAMVVRHAAE